MNKSDIVKHAFLHRYDNDDRKLHHWNNFVKSVQGAKTTDLNQLPALATKYMFEIDDEWKRRSSAGDPDTKVY